MPPELEVMQSFRMSNDALERLNTLAKAQGRTRADVIRRCLDRGIADEEADLETLAAIRAVQHPKKR